MNHDFNLDATKEKNMKLSQAHRSVLIAIAGFLLTALFPRDWSLSRNPSGVKILSLFTVRGPMDQAGPK